MEFSVRWVLTGPPPLIPVGSWLAYELARRPSYSLLTLRAYRRHLPMKDASSKTYKTSVVRSGIAGEAVDVVLPQFLSGVIYKFLFGVIFQSLFSRCLDSDGTFHPLHDEWQSGPCIVKICTTNGIVIRDVFCPTLGPAPHHTCFRDVMTGSCCEQWKCK